MMLNTLLFTFFTLLFFATLCWAYLSVPQDKMKDRPSTIGKIIQLLAYRQFVDKGIFDMILSIQLITFMSLLLFYTIGCGGLSVPYPSPKRNERHILFCCKNHPFFNLRVICREYYFRHDSEYSSFHVLAFTPICHHRLNVAFRYPPK